MARPSPLIPPAPIRARVDRRLVVLTVLVLCGVVGALLVWKRPTARRGHTLPMATSVDEGSVASLPTVMDIRRTTSYAQTLPAPPPPSPGPLFPPAAEPGLPPVPGVLPASLSDGALPGTLPAASGRSLTAPQWQPDPAAVPSAPPPSGSPTSGQGTPGKKPAPAPPPPSQTPRPPSAWLFPTMGTGGAGVQAPPFPLEGEEAGAPGKPEAAKGAQLFPKAVWERPARPERILYANQVLNGLLQHDVDSDHPGIIRVLLAEQVEDQWGQGVVLLPQYTELITTQDGKPSYGQKTLGVIVNKGIVRSGPYAGTTIAFPQTAKLASATGTTGLPGDVDNHWDKIIIGAGVGALLNIGARAPFGSTDNFQPTLPQQYGADVAGSVNRSTQDVLKRELNVSPTIRAKRGTPVTIQLLDNVSFQTEPVLIRK